jgi:predicted dehydrogenase
MDVGIYALQTTRYLTGEEPIWVSATTTRGDPTRFSEVEESVLWQARFPSGAISHCGASYNTAPLGYFRAIADHGWFGLDPAFFYDGLRGTRSDGKAIDFSLRSTSLRQRWMTSPNASCRRSRARCRARKACVM